MELNNRRRACWPIAIAITSYCVALLLTINGRSLWTDEAFSAYIADHKNIVSLFSTLFHGDSSDLQVAMYYLYLHGWTLIFGSTEFALHAANIPFIVGFCVVLLWASLRTFRSSWVWIPAGFLPFLWVYAGQARAYFALVCFSTVCFTSLICFLENPTRREERILPWLLLVSLFLGTTFHMLMLLAVPPMLGVVIFYSRIHPIHFTAWKRPILAFSIPFLLLMGYLIWTFLRGTAYDYSRPDFLSMGSVFYRLIGLSGFGPNRRYDIPFHSYLFKIGIAAIVLLTGFLMAAVSGMRGAARNRLLALFLAMFVAIAEVVALSAASREQIDLRHLGGIVPLLLLLVMASLSSAERRKNAWVAFAAAVLIGSVWIGSDYRFLFLPEYRDEDFRGAVSQAIDLKRQSGGSIAVVADPAAAAYYGLNLRGAAPCFPLVDDCQSGFQKVNWRHQVPADYAYLWKVNEIHDWMEKQRNRNLPMIVIISESRFPGLKDSPWWPVLLTDHYPRYTRHGFSIFVLR